MTLEGKVPDGPMESKWEQPQVRHELGGPCQSPQVRRHRRRHRPRRSLRRGQSRRARLQRGSPSPFSTVRAARTVSPRRAASTPPRTTRTTATRCTALFYDTIKGGDYRSREANVYRLAEVSVDIIDQCAAQGVPFAREYGGTLANRSFGGAQVSRTFYARGQTGQQLLLGAYSSLMRQVERGQVKLFPRQRDARPGSRRRRGARHHHAQPGHRRARALRGRHRAALHRRLRQRLLPVDQCREQQRNGSVALRQTGRLHGQPMLRPDPPDLHSAKRRVPGQAHLDEREPAQRRPGVGAGKEGRLALSSADSGERTRLFPREEVPELREPGSARRRLPQREIGLRRRARGRRRPGARSTSTSAMRSSATAPRSSPSATATSSRCTSGLPGSTSTPRRRCRFIPPCTTSWAASGSTTT